MTSRFRLYALFVPLPINPLKSHQTEMPIMFPRDPALRQLTEARELERFTNVNMQAQGSKINT